MTHLLKYLAVPMAFMAAVVLFASPSAPGALGSVGGVAYAEGGQCYGGSDTNGSGENSDYGDDSCEPPSRCEFMASADPMMMAGVGSGFGGLGGACWDPSVDPHHICIVVAAIVASGGAASGNGAFVQLGIWLAAACGIWGG